MILSIEISYYVQAFLVAVDNAKIKRLTLWDIDESRIVAENFVGILSFIYLASSSTSTCFILRDYVN